MAPRSCSSFLAYMTAWMTTLAWQALAVSVGYIIATMLQGIIVLTASLVVAVALTVLGVAVGTSPQRMVLWMLGSLLILAVGLCAYGHLTQRKR